MFSKKSEEPTRPSLPKVQSKSVARGNGSTFSVIGSDVVITGNIAASADLHVDGTIEGDISCASIVQGEDSVITGSVEAATARLAGTVRGSINSTELIILQSARIEGDVHYDALTIEQGAQVEGRFSHSKPKAASGKASKSASTASEDPSLILAS